MHNSLMIRDRLRQANTDVVFTRFRDPYRGMTILPGQPANVDELRLSGKWQVCMNESIAPASAAVLLAELEQLGNRLGMQVEPWQEKEGLAPDRRIVLEVRADLSTRDAAIEVDQDSIVLAGGDISGIWAALSWFVWEVRVKRCAVVSLGRTELPALWRLQISQGPWGGNYSVPDFSPEYLSDESFRLYALSGVNSMMIYGDLLCYAKSSILPQLNHMDADRHLEILQDAGERASRYGIGFTYVPVHPKLAPDHPVFLAHPETRGRGYCNHGHEFNILCSSQHEALGFYAEQYERLFGSVPQLQAVLAITYSESFYHCDMWRVHERTPCPNCRDLPGDQRVIPLLNTVSDAVRKANPDAFLAEWIYSWPPPDNGNRSLAQIHDTRPSRIGICQAVDKDPLYDGKTVYRKPGYTKSIWDYSLEVEEPTDYAKQAAKYAEGTSRRFVAKTETGIGIETMQFPYVPAFSHLARKWEGVRRLKSFGVHQAWLFYGHHLSRAERLANWAAYRTGQPADEFLEEMAKADFGPGAVSSVLACWSRFGRAIKHLPCLHLGAYYQSPSFFGPCHPLLPDSRQPIPDIFHVCLYYLQEHGLTFSPSQLKDCREPMVLSDLPRTPEKVQIQPDPGLGWELVIDEYADAAKEAEKGWRHLAEAEKFLESPQDRLNWEEEMALTELLWRTFLSCEHVVRFLLARRQWEETEANQALAEMRLVARLEFENAEAALPIYKAAPWLDPAVRLDGVFPPAAALIREKCEIIRRFLAEEEERRQ